MSTYVSILGVGRVLRATVRDGHDVGGLKGTAHLVLVVKRILGAVIGINGAEPVAKDVVVGIRGNLEQSGGLGVDDGVGHVKVEVGLAASGFGRVGGGGTVDQVQVGASVLGDPRGKVLEEVVEILLGVDVAKRLVDAQGVGAVGLCGLGDLVESSNAVGGNVLGTSRGYPC